MEQYQHTVISPGRVNLLGEHIDYCNGPVLPVAIDRSVSLEFSPRTDRLVKIQALDLQDSVCFSLDDLQTKNDCHQKPLPGWAKYPAGVAFALQEHGLPLAGMNARFRSNIPIGAGLSSSAAIEVAFAVAWEALADWQVSRMTLAQLCQRAENHYVGVNCGLMDQFAAAHGVEDHALYFKINQLVWEAVPLPDHIAIVIADSKVPHSLTTSAYNDRRAATEEALRLLQVPLPHITALVDVTPHDFERHQHSLPPLIAQRARHVVYECDRMNQAVIALKEHDIVAFGALMYATHASLRDLYEVSVPEIDLLVEIARSLPGCYGARLTGGGFGGCTVNLVAIEQAQDFAQALAKEYQARTQYQGEVYISKASRGAYLLR